MIKSTTTTKKVPKKPRNTPSKQSYDSWIGEDQIDFDKHNSFVYIVTEYSDKEKTEVISMYVGKKCLTTSRRKLLTKKELDEIPVTRGRRPKKRLEVKQSDINTYWSSSKTLQDRVKTRGPEYFDRRILYLCVSKQQASYLEERELYKRLVLENQDLYLNQNIGGVFYPKTAIGYDELAY